VNSGFRDILGDWLGCPRWLGCHKHGRRKIPASALVALNPGKASPLVFGGKIHTPADTSDRCYPGPLSEAVRILDYWFHLMHGGERCREPRELDDFHYARLYRVRAQQGGEEYWLALKDAIEPNRRNINGVYRVQAYVDGGRAVCSDAQVVTWGVETELDREVGDNLKRSGGKAERVPVREIELASASGTLRFAQRRGMWGGVQALAQKALGEFERFMGSNTFLTFFAAAFLIAKLVDIGMTAVFTRWTDFAQWFFNWFFITLPFTVALQLWVVLWLIGTKIPTMIDNAYKHLNKADNLRSLRRVKG
jgi:hypothetical protein